MRRALLAMLLAGVVCVGLAALGVSWPILVAAGVLIGVAVRAVDERHQRSS